MPRTKRRLSREQQRLVERLTREMAALPAESARETRRLLASAQRDLRDAFAEWLADQDPESPMTLERYRELVRALRGDPRNRVPLWVPPLSLALYRTLSKGRRAAGYLAAQHTMVEAQTAVGSLRHLRPISVAAVEMRGKRALDGRLTRAATGHARDIYEDVKRRLMLGVSGQETVGQLASRLGGQGTKLGFARVVKALEHEPEKVAAHIAETLASRALNILERLVVTEVVNAYNTAKVISIKQFEQANQDMVVLKQWDASLDSNMCEDCGNLHGVTVELDDEFEPGVFNPPYHPQCNCMVITFTAPRENDTAEAQQAEEVEDERQAA